jgi:hypothetical protein
MLLSVLQTCAAIVLGLPVLLKLSLPAPMYKYQKIILNARKQISLLDKCDLTKITPASHKTKERMFFPWVVHEVAL